MVGHGDVRNRVAYEREVGCLRGFVGGVFVLRAVERGVGFADVALEIVALREPGGDAIGT